MHRYSLAAGDVADDRFSPDGIAAARAIDQQVTVSLDANGVALVSAKYAADHTADSSRAFVVSWGWGFRGRREFAKNLARGIFAVADAGHQVVGLAKAVVRCDP